MSGARYMPRKEALESLNLTDGASDRDIVKAYRKLALINHPDKGGNVEKFQKIALAKESLDHHAEKKTKSQGTSTQQSQQEIRPTVDQECQGTFTEIRDILEDNLKDRGYNEGNSFYYNNLDKIQWYSMRRTSIYHNLHGEKKRTYLSKLERLLVLKEILKVVNGSHRVSQRTPNFSYITQELLDFLLDSKTNLSEIQTTFESLFYSNNLNISTIDFVITKPAYSSILASTLHHVSKTHDSDNSNGDVSEERLTAKTSLILDFYSFFSITSMESIEFEATLLKATTNNAIDAVIEEYQTLLIHTKAQKEANEEKLRHQEEDMGTNETKEPETEILNREEEEKIRKLNDDIMASVIVSPVRDDSKLTEPSVMDVIEGSSVITGETMTEAQNHQSLSNDREVDQKQRDHSAIKIQSLVRSYLTQKNIKEHGSTFDQGEATASVIISPVRDDSKLTEPSRTGEMMTEADIIDDKLSDCFYSSKETNDNFESLRVTIKSFSEYVLKKNNQVGMDVAKKLNEKLSQLNSHGSSLTPPDKVKMNEMKKIIIDSYKALGPTADGIGYFHTLLRNISLCLSYLSSLISGSQSDDSQSDDIDQKSVEVGQINPTFFARSTRQEKAVEIDEELKKCIADHPKPGVS